MQKIRLMFQKVQNSILTQIKASRQVSYDMYQANTVTYYFIANILVEEAVSIGYHTTQGFVDINICGYKAPDSGVKVSGRVIFTLFYPN